MAALPLSIVIEDYILAGKKNSHHFSKLENGLNVPRVSCMGGIAPGPNPMNPAV